MDVVIYGFGPIGRAIAECCVKRGYNVLGAVDINPELKGRQLSDFGIDSSGIVKDSLDFEGDVAFICTGSYLDRVYPQIEECLKRGFNVLSTCETLSYPFYRYPELAAKIDEMAKKCEKTVVGTGINPGFLLDALVITLSAPFVEIERIKAVRSIDALKRRGPFRKKVGIGLNVDDAEKKLRNGEITGHVGYAESVLLISKSLSFEPDEVREGQKFVTGEDDKVIGAIGFGSALKQGKERIRVEFHAYAKAEEYEEIIIEGDNSVKWRSTGTKGDLGTAAVIVNLADCVASCEAGLKTMADLIPFRSKIR
ncbi:MULTISPECIES: dihydrodipicolinate reductase [unclassified Archaeoglobus]|jgi:4-hydroxy-tetrahydrodipicolinate reductase|uniref:dihydrodipicolinate reductase n=1 Tax=unclassified Archaeoglobus TaxID=2643606 RepID=UPI0025C31BC4|nr:MULTISPECIES: dihydrodipicolinate reductase [unclassified Archaeoglobus]